MSSQPHVDDRQRSIAILVLGCASPPYDRTIESIRQTWGSARIRGVDVYYVYGVPDAHDARADLSRIIAGDLPHVAAGGIRQIGNVLITGCADALAKQQDCLLRKRLIAFDHLARDSTYDWLYTVCATSYVDLNGLTRHAASLPRRPFVSGAIGIDPSQTTPFVSGASMLMTADVAARLGRERDQIIAGNRFGAMDDVTIGHWVASRMGDRPLEGVVNDIKEARALPSEYILISCPRTTCDYVMAPPEKHRPAPHAFHYHFHSRGSEDMLRFHQRHFAESSRRGAE